MSFEALLAATAQDTDRLLAQLISAYGGPAARLMEAVRYASLGQGKRLRPFMVVQSARLFDVPAERTLRVGAALECVHCYSLVHDDLPAMDDDDLRRGRPTVHRAFDEATAILAGDALLSLAFEILAGTATHPDGARRAALVAALAKASGMAGMVGGQALDIEAEQRVISAVSDIELIQSLKTGALFRFACEAGPMLAGADTQPLRQYADDIGLAFQIADDILDVESDAATLGKATQKDGARGKATFVDLLGLDGAKRRAAELSARAVAALSLFGPAAEPLREAARFIVARRK